MVGKNHHHRTTEKQVLPDQIGDGFEIFFADGLVDRLAAGTGELNEAGEEVFSWFGVVKIEGAALVVDALEKSVDLIKTCGVVVGAGSPAQAIEVNGFRPCPGLGGGGKSGGPIIGDEFCKDAGGAVSDEGLAGFGGLVAVAGEEIVVM